MFCDINPTCYKIALQKEIYKRHIKNFLGHEVYAALYDTEPLPQLVSACSSHLIKRGKDIEPKLQENKAININLANQTMNGILLRPGETFSFWKLVGKTTKRKGYQEGRVLVRSRILPGLGGGLCNLANTIHRVVLLSPLTVTEFHQRMPWPRTRGSASLSALERPCFTITEITASAMTLTRPSSCSCGVTPTIYTPSCAANSLCLIATASWRKGTTFKKKVKNTIAFPKSTKKRQTRRRDRSSIKPLC